MLRTEKARHAPRRIWFQYADMRGFSGQREASRLIYENLDSSYWRVELLRMPALERCGGRWLSLVRYAARLASAWARGLRIGLGRAPLLHLNLGQTGAAILRDGFPLKIAFGLRRERRVVISLHGSNFMAWPEDCGVVKRFVQILKFARVVTVLGESQRRRLVGLGIDESRVRVVPNTCAVVAISEDEVSRKQRDGGPLRVLFLSSLIDTKGYPEYLEALLDLSARSDVVIDGVLCGPLTTSQFGDRFESENEARAWIEGIIARINQSNNVRVRWIPGASGDSKWALYRDAHVFVLPSRYVVEAQPIVLLEAMAHGCAVVCSTVGEIRSILSDSEGVLLDRCGAIEVASGILNMANNWKLREQYAKAGWNRFKQEFALDRYVARWNAILSEIDSGAWTEPGH